MFVFTQRPSCGARLLSSDMQGRVVRAFGSWCGTARIRRRKSRQPSTGFTLIELMMVIVILGVLIALAAPGFHELIARWRVIETTESLQSTLYFARAEAIKRGGQVGIRKIANNTDGCTSATTSQDWSCGWFVYAASKSDGTWKSTDEVLMRVAASPNLDVMNNRGGQEIVLNRWGNMSGLGAKGFNIKAASGTKAERGICVSSGGRIRVISDPPCV